MPEYRRFIAYFYEYIDGKRRRNAGFVKAEQRNGVWRLQVQLRSENWPPESLQMFGFSRKGEEYPAIWLGKGYPKGDSMIQLLQIQPKDLKISFEKLSGMWIPCQENWCFLSNWEDANVEIERLRMPLSEAGEGTEKITEEKPVSIKKETTEAADLITEDRNVDETLVEAMECPVIEGKEQEPEMQCSPEIESSQEIGETDHKSRAPGGESWKEIQSESQRDMRETEIQKEVGDDIPEEDREKDRKRLAMENAWRTLLSQCQKFRPFAEEEYEECIRICPRDILWLRQRQWPVGRNSFLMQGFCRYRHLLLARKTDGSYMLGIPGRKMPQNHSAADSFGFGNFKAVDSGMICPEDFGYWYRIISI